MQVAVFGGSFDPPHIGHALVVAWLLWTRQAERVIVVPVGDHPFGKALSPHASRLRWARALAAPHGDRVQVSSIEAGLPQPNYTIVTLDALASADRASTFRLVVGADILPELPRWHRGEELVRRYAPIVVGRTGYPSPEGTPEFPGVSSTEVRRRLAADLDVSALVPAAVLDAIGDADRARWRALGST